MSQKQVDWDRVRKLIGNEALEKLSKKTVAVICQGGLGSWATEFLAMSGVGRYILVDPETLEAHNVVRHAAGLNLVGRSKVFAVKTKILQRNRRAKVTIVKKDVRLVPKVLKPADLVLVAGPGSGQVELAIGQICRDLKKPELVGGVWEKGVGGDVYFVDQSETGPCFACFAHNIVETDISPEIKVDYGRPRDEIKAEPGLGLDIISVAHRFADIALRILINDPKVRALPPTNWYRMINENHEVTFRSGKKLTLKPGERGWNEVLKFPECLICGKHENLPKGSIQDILDRS